MLLLLVPTLGVATPENGDPSGTSLLQGSVFGTFYEVSLAGEWSGQQQEQVHEGIREVLAEIDRSMSTYRDDSEVNAFNATDIGTWMELSAPLDKVLRIARQVSLHTDGAFDVTAGRLVNLWGFGPDSPPDHKPTVQALEAARAEAGHGNLELEPTRPRARRQSSLQLDLSGIAKGYAVGAVGQYLESRGIHDYLVNIGGDLQARGYRDGTQAWRIAVEMPPDPATGPRAPVVIPLLDKAVATSGDYRNLREYEGARYSHIIDPRNGRPIDHGLASVTVMHDSATWADAYATGLMVLGTGEAEAVAGKRALKVILVSRAADGPRIYKSPAMRAYLEARR